MVARYGKGQEPDKEGTIMFTDFALGGQWFAAMDSARTHDFAFNEAISLLIPCETQDEIDYYWKRLSADPKAEQCGWLKDKFGLSWQAWPDRAGRDAAEGHARAGRARDAGVPPDEEVRHRGAEAGLRGTARPRRPRDNAESRPGRPVDSTPIDPKGRRRLSTAAALPTGCSYSTFTSASSPAFDTGGDTHGTGVAESLIALATVSRSYRSAKRRVLLVPS